MRLVGSLIALCLLQACSSVPSVEKVQPPFELLQDCPQVECQYKTNEQLVLCIQDYKARLKTCNEDRLRLRTWFDQQ